MTPSFSLSTYPVQKFLCFESICAIQWHKTSERLMEEILSQILDACKLARELESSLLLLYVDVASDPHYLLRSCEEIVGAFNKAVHGLYAMQSQAPGLQMLLMSAGEGTGNLLCTGIPAQISPENQPREVTESEGGLSYLNSGAPGQRKGKSVVQRSSKKRWKLRA